MALLLNGIPGLRHVVYDVMSDVLTYIDFNTSGQNYRSSYQLITFSAIVQLCNIIVTFVIEPVDYYELLPNISTRLAK